MFDTQAIIASGGILIVAAIVFAESGLLIGFFLPGDTLLFSAGLLAAQGTMSLPLLLVATITAAIIGDNVGYSIGRRAGPRIFKKEDGILFHKDHLMRAEKFYEDHGGKTVTLARFVPVVRTFAPVVAGAGKMPRKRFMMYNVVGAVLWGGGVTLLGYWLGTKIPGLDHYIEYVLIGVIVLSLGLSFLHVLREPKARKAMAAGIKNQLSKLALNKKVD
jgi:membrane-associated protein